MIHLFEVINATPKLKPKPKPSQPNQKKTIFEFTAESEQKRAPNKLTASKSFKSKVKPSTPAKKRIKRRAEPNLKFKKIYNYFEKVKPRQDEGGGDSEPT